MVWRQLFECQWALVARGAGNEVRQKGGLRYIRQVRTDSRKKLLDDDSVFEGRKLANEFTELGKRVMSAAIVEDGSVCEENRRLQLGPPIKNGSSAVVGAERFVSVKVHNRSCLNGYT